MCAGRRLLQSQQVAQAAASAFASGDGNAQAVATAIVNSGTDKSSASAVATAAAQTYNRSTPSFVIFLFEILTKFPVEMDTDWSGGKPEG